MENKYFAILMFAFAALHLIYAGIMYLTKDSKMVMRDYAVNMKDKKAYARQFAKVVALFALSPILSGIAAMVWSIGVGLIVLILASIVLLAIGTRSMRGFY